MKLSEIITNPNESLNYMERYINDGSPSGFTWVNNTSPLYSPRSNTKDFYLYECICKSGKVETQGDIPIGLHEDSLLIHPDMIFNEFISKNCKIRRSKYAVIPTSSGRTVRIDNLSSVYVKLHYDGTIGRVNRKITRNHAMSSLEVSSLLTSAIDQQVLPDYFAFLPENGAKITSLNSNIKKYEFGTVFRNDIPYSKYADDIKIIIPLFSLLSKDLFNTSESALLKQILQHNGIKPYDFIVEQLIRKLIECYFCLILNLGLQPEWHGQNVLLGFNKTLTNIYIIARDLDSVDKDITIMESLDLETSFKSHPYKCIDSTQYNYYMKHSFMYDHKLGEYILKPLVKFLETSYGLDSKKIISDIRDISRIYIKQLPQNFFPMNNMWYKFDNVLVNQDLAYRPYIEIKEPIFR